MFNHEPNRELCSPPALPRRTGDPSVPPVQYVGGDAGGRSPPPSTPVHPEPPSEPLFHAVRRDTSLASGNLTRTGGTAMTPATPPQTQTTESCSLALFTGSSERYPPTGHDTFEVKREQAGKKTTDHEFFMVLREVYYGRLMPPFQRLLSLYTLKDIVFVERTKEGLLIPLARLQRDIIHAPDKPHLISTVNSYYMDWICNLEEGPGHEYGVLFIHIWDRQKIAVVVGVPWVISVVTAIGWIAGTGDITNAMAVSSYIMSATGVVVGLLAVLSAVEA